MEFTNDSKYTIIFLIDIVAWTIITLLHVPPDHIPLRHFLLLLVSCLICKEGNRANYKDGSSIYQSVWVTEHILSLNEVRWDDTGRHLIHRTPFKLRMLGCRPRAQVLTQRFHSWWRVKKLARHCGSVNKFPTFRFIVYSKKKHSFDYDES